MIKRTPTGYVIIGSKGAPISPPNLTWTEAIDASRRVEYFKKKNKK